MKHNMAFDLLTSLLCPFSSALRIWKMEKALKEHIAHLPYADRLLLRSEPVSVDNFLAQLLAATERCLSRGIGSHTITNIFFFKDQSKSSEHEFIVLECKFPASEKTFHIVIERTHGADTGSAETRTEPANTNTKPLPLHSVRDQVHGIVGLDALKPLKPIAIYHPPTPIRLLEAACLLQVLHQEAKDYVLLDRQCYWLTATVWDVLCKRHHDTFSEEEHQDVQSGTSGLSGAGRCRGFEIISLKAEDIEQLSKRLDDELAVLVQELATDAERDMAKRATERKEGKAEGEEEVER
ncbi:hypothetical protein BKA70DRAFT_512400 [Coprinopsis sp. MPI-PUGE-AT-0042]|nr:hypothetical protein BKA70DRAFT_512400 [Coprinopsis sp. MPI-PUGE-AT-0042]